MAAHQAPRSLGFSRQEHWSGLPFPPPMHESEKESEVAQSCPTLHDPMDCSLPGSSIHGIFQARVLEWVPLPSQYSVYGKCSIIADCIDDDPCAFNYFLKFLNVSLLPLSMY